MSDLVRQPGGFEGFVPRPKDLYALDQFAPEAIHPDCIARDRHAAGSATSVEAVYGHHARIGIDQFDQVGGVVIEGLLRGGGVSLYTLDPVVDGGPGEFALIAPFNVWMKQRGSDTVEVLRPGLAPVEGV